jgi:hypothetical protein
VVILQAGAATPACKHLSPHQHRAESFALKRDAGEGNQRIGVYEHIVTFLNIKLFIFLCCGHFLQFQDNDKLKCDHSLQLLAQEE